MKRKFIKNIVSGFGAQFLIIILGIIVPRVMIVSYGSDLNGLLSTVGQIFSYLALLEAGIGQSARIALYEPLSNNDKEGVSKVFASAETYFRKITFLYAMGVLLLAILVPLIIKSDVDKITIFLIIIFEGMGGVISFYYVETPSILLSSDGKGYVNNAVNFINKLIGYVSKIVFAMMGVNIVFVQFVYFLINVAKVFFYQIYYSKKYSWITKKYTVDFKLLKDKHSYLLTEIAWTIFSSTDMIVLSIFISTRLASVYSVYSMIYNSLNTLLNAVAGSVLYVLGQSYHNGIDEYEIVHDFFNTLYTASMTALVSVSYVLTIPFISLYTSGVNDVNYIYPQMPFMFALIQILSWSRYVNGNLTGLSGYARKTSYISVLEAIINVIGSLILVQLYGIVGVLIATVIALPIKVIWCIYISDKKVLCRSMKKSMSILGCNLLFFLSIVFLSKYIELSVQNYFSFIIHGFVTLIVITVPLFLINFGVNRESWDIIKRFCIKR